MMLLILTILELASCNLCEKEEMNIASIFNCLFVIAVLYKSLRIIIGSSLEIFKKLIIDISLIIIF